MFLIIWMAAAGAIAQVELVADNFFPAALEFAELGDLIADESFDDPARLGETDDGALFADVGFEKYGRRVYATAASGSLTIEVVTLRDSRAAFSLLTLLRSSAIQDGPPGDAYSADPDLIRFAKDRQWARIRGRGVSADLLRRVALSVSNRIGKGHQNPPSLVSHFPKTGYDPASLRYFVGTRSFKSHAITPPGGFVRFTPDMELAQARYNVQGQTGTLSLSIFPTAQVAEGYFEELGPGSAPAKGIRIYTKRAGPLIAILEGTFDPGVADTILDQMEYSYSIRWIYEKPKSKTIWGVPAAILGTVVNSLLFVVVLCAVSILAGFGYAIFRFWLRGHAPQNPLDRPERTEITHLKMR